MNKQGISAATVVTMLVLAGCASVGSSPVPKAAAAPTTVAPNVMTLEQRVAAQNALFDEDWEYQMRAHPERATAYGDYRYNDQLDQMSLQALSSNHAHDEDMLKRLQAISTSGFVEQDQLSHQVMERTLQQRLDNWRFKEYEMPLSQMSGVHVDLADLPLSMPFNSVHQYEDYISRLHQIPRAFDQTQEVLRAGEGDGLMPVRFLLEKVPAQCAGVIKANPFLKPLSKFPADFSQADKDRLSAQINDAVTREVLPAYQKFADFIEHDYAPHGRTQLAVSSLPGGDARYLNDIRNSTSLSDLTPAQIHQIGLDEITRIEAAMTSIAHQQGFADLASFRESLKHNPKYHPQSAEQIVDDFRHYIDQMWKKLPELFGYIPNAPVTVEAIPAFQSAMATHYQSGTSDGARPGRVVVAPSHFEDRTLIDDEATAYHEGVPGHHMQLSVAQRMTGLPKFRQHAFNSGYGEGWALYSEELGKEVGFYQDPVSDYGRLASEMFRAVRLVVDTGIHSMGWSRDQVVEFFRRYQVVDEPTIQAETDRYIAWPAQALSYKLGQLKFRELRRRSQAALGSKFDIRAFHDEMLSGGVLPLDLLDARTNEWIKQQLARP